MKRWFSLLIAASLVAEQVQLPKAHAQDDDLDRLFEEDTIDEPFGEAVPPPQPPPMDFEGGPPPGAGFTPPDNNPPPPSPPGGSGFAPGNGRFNGGTGNGNGGTSWGGGPSLVPKGDVKSRFSKAQIEDITNGNFPETIESFDFPNADIKDVIKAISELTGKNFIIESTISGRVTIMAPSKITVAEAYKAFLSALAGLGYTIVPSGRFLKIKSARNAQRDSIETYTGAYYPNADVLITRIMQLKYTSADEINKRLRVLPSKEGEMTPYEPTNSLIITDYGSNIDRIMKIIHELDKPGFEETLEVVPIRYAKAKDIAELLNQIINKELGGTPGAGGFRPGTPRFRSRTATANSGTPEELSLVAPDDRTNAIIVLGTKAGIQKVRGLVKKLDYKLDPSESGGVFVYYVKYGEAEKIAAVLQGVSSGGTGGGSSPSSGSSPSGSLGSPNRSFVPPTERREVFGGDVKITADKVTNSLVIVANRQDYDVVKSLLAKIDIPRDQVFVEAIIMEMNSDKSRDWNPAFYYLDKGSNGIGRAGFSRQGTLSSILSPGTDSGAVLSFGGGDTFTFTIPGTSQTVEIKSLLSFINFLQTYNQSNILSTPQLLALDNEAATIEVADKVPIGQSTQTTTGGLQTTAPQFEDAGIKLEVTPFISPDSDSVRMKIKQSVGQPTAKTVRSKALNDSATIVTKRTLDTNIVVKSGDTAVLGGLIRDEEALEETKVPLLGDIPVLGWLFKSSKKTKNKVNLLVFLTPKIIRNMADSHDLLNKKANSRIQWIKDNFDGRDPYGKVIEDLPRATASEGDDSVESIKKSN